jgi:hypothetical protein
MHVSVLKYDWMKGRQKVCMLKEELNKDASNFAKITSPKGTSR